MATQRCWYRAIKASTVACCCSERKKKPISDIICSRRIIICGQIMEQDNQLSYI